MQPYPDTVAALLRAYFRAVAVWKQHPDDAIAMVAEEYGQTTDEVYSQLQGVRLIDLSANQTAFTRTDQPARSTSIWGHWHWRSFCNAVAPKRCRQARSIA